MIRLSNQAAKAMEFTSFKKKDSVTDDELLNASLNFESVLAERKGIIFHCLVRNFNNDYANVLFVENPAILPSIVKEINSIPEASNFFNLIESDSVNMQFHEILKENFFVPNSFSCIECGSFSLKKEVSFDRLVKVSTELEIHYLNNFENHMGHFIGRMENNRASEIAFGKTYIKTKQECYGYFDNQHGTALLDLAETTSLNLDFWYLVA